MAKASSSRPSQDFIVALLRANEVNAIAIIDDAYDSLLNGEIRDDEIDLFWAFITSEKASPNIEAKKEFDAFCEELGITISAPEEIDHDLLKSLWEQRLNLSALKKPLDQLFETKIHKLAQIERFCKNLYDRCRTNNECTVEIRRRGREVNIDKDLEGVAIVFIDYRLGADNDRNSVNKANDIATQIYKRYSRGKMPLIILMSSDSSVEKYMDEFRQKSGLLAGMFQFVSKTDLENKEKLGINLGTWAERLEKGGEIQRFANVIEGSFHLTIKDFIKAVKNLSLEDYAYVQNLSLLHEGQPLGDYMLWLFNAYLGRLLFENNAEVRQQQSVIDKLFFNRLPINPTMPSLQLVEMYDSALFNTNVGDVSRHPSLPDRSPDTKATDQQGVDRHQTGDSPYLNLGLVFVKDEATDVQMVINADCDLAFTATGTRVCDPDNSVLLIPGKLQELKKGERVPEITKTEFFRYKEKTFRILWQINKVRSLEYANVLGQLTTEGYSPYARLRLPFALEVQRAFSSNLTRIGMPVAPPINQPVQVQILCKGEDNATEVLLDSQDDLAFLLSVRNSEMIEDKHQLHCRFIKRFGHELKDAIIKLMKKYKAEISNLDEGMGGYEAKFSRLSDKVVKLSTLKKEFDEWFLQNPSYVLKADNAIHPYHTDLIGICRNKDNNEPYGGSSYLLLVNLIDV